MLRPLPESFDHGPHPFGSLAIIFANSVNVERTMSKVLLVEDQEMNRDMLSRRLIKQGFEVVIAVDGEEGVARAKDQNPDIILMDMNLPVMDGWEATRAIKQCEQTKHIPIIALTAHAMTKDRDSTIEAGCDEYETKPIDFKRLVAKMEDLVNKNLRPQ